MTKDQMLLDLVFKTKIMFWSGIVLGSLSIGILGYAFVRNWNKWKEGRQRRNQESTNTAADDSTSHIDLEEETGDVPEGELCVICLMRRRRSAFIPCGHLVCCQHCAISVERELVPKCPVCRMAIRSSMRIYASQYADYCTEFCNYCTMLTSGCHEKASGTVSIPFPIVEAITKLTTALLTGFITLKGLELS